MSEQPSITCPVCGCTSWHPQDIAEGYCGYCHDWTGGVRVGTTLWSPVGPTCLLCSRPGTHRFAAVDGPDGWLCEMHKDDPVGDWGKEARRALVEIAEIAADRRRTVLEEFNVPNPKRVREDLDRRE